MKVSIDTNVLVRLLTADDATQVEAALRLLSQATTIVLSMIALCETVWVTRQVYHIPAQEVADRLTTFLEDERVDVDRLLAKRGLAFLAAGGDFADLVIASEGRRLGAELFATFDRDAARRLEEAGLPVTLLS